MVERYLGGVKLELNPQWKHEKAYLDYLDNGCLTSSIAMDLFVYGRLMKAGDHVLDLGANIGFTAALACAHDATLVRCLEPDLRVARRLMYIDDPRVQALPYGASTELSWSAMRVSVGHNQGSSCDPDTWTRHKCLQEAPTVAVPVLDVLHLAEVVDFIKVDVEGMESTILPRINEAKNKARLIYFERHGADVSFLKGMFPDYALYRVVVDLERRSGMYIYDDSPLPERCVSNPPSFIMCRQFALNVGQWVSIKEPAKGNPQ